MVEWAAVLLHNHEGPASNPGKRTGFSMDSTSSLEHVWIVPQTML